MLFRLNKMDSILKLPSLLALNTSLSLQARNRLEKLIYKRLEISSISILHKAVIWRPWQARQICTPITHQHAATKALRLSNFLNMSSN